MQNSQAFPSMLIEAIDVYTSTDISDQYNTMYTPDPFIASYRHYHSGRATYVDCPKVCATWNAEGIL